MVRAGDPAPDGNGALAVSDYGSRVAWGVSLKSRWPALAAALDGLDRNDPAPFKLLGAFNPLLSPIQTDGPGFYGIACRNGLLPTTPEAAAAMTSEFSANRTRLRLWYAFRDVGPCVELGFRAEPLPPVRSLTTIPPLILRRDTPTVPAIWADRVAATLVPSFVVKLTSDLTCAFDTSGDYLVNLRRPTTEVCS